MQKFNEMIVYVIVCVCVCVIQIAAQSEFPCEMEMRVRMTNVRELLYINVWNEIEPKDVATMQGARWKRK